MLEKNGFDPILNYFNYFTEIEEHFQRARGTGLFLLSPLDWALIETWKNAGVPLEAVLRGIDTAFENWRGRKVKSQMVNSLAFCAQAVTAEAQVMAGAGRPAARQRVVEPRQLALLDHALAGHHHHVLLGHEFLDRQEGADLLVGL